MDPRLHQSTHQNQGGSLFGFDLTRYVDEISGGPARDAALSALTHGGIQPEDLSRRTIGLYDQAALTVFERHPDIVTDPAATAPAGGVVLRLYVNTLGRLHIRPADQPDALYDPDDHVVEVGRAALSAAQRAEVEAEHAALLAAEAVAMAEVRAALDRVHAAGELPTVLEQVIDHVEHVESVGFFVGDRFLALIDRFVNLIDHKGRPGWLTALRGVPYADWTDEAVLVVSALHALFLSGRAVRFEEFNGARLTARDLVERLRDISDAYTRASCEVEMPEGLDLFDRARVTFQQAMHAVGKPWLRYRWVYGLSFLKTERILESMESDEDPDVWREEFAEDHADLLGGSIDAAPSEHVAFTALAHAAVAHDLAGVPPTRGSAAVTSWVEYLMERIVASAVRATAADYGMSSSLRDLNRLVTYDEAALVDEIHALTPNHFFTCFTSADLVARVGEEEAGMIATSVQKRMMFNRWHFMPGNLSRPLVRKTRHWYYPPLVPDIAVHADMHRAAHNRARVKHSIRAPGPDMSRPPLHIGGEPFRGFYDVRVVRMEGDGFTMEDLLRTRRRTLWLESLYAALVQNAHRPGRVPMMVNGFQPGLYLDVTTAPAAARRPVPVVA